MPCLWKVHDVKNLMVFDEVVKLFGFIKLQIYLCHALLAVSTPRMGSKAPLLYLCLQ